MNPLYAELGPLLDSPSADPIREKPVSNGGRIWAFCGVHPDGQKYGKRSLSLHPRYGLECFAGCEFRDVVKAIRELGSVYPVRSAPTQPFPHKRSGRGELGDTTGSWTYQDERAQTLFRVVRLEGAAGKTFLQQHPAGSCVNHLGESCKPAGKGWRWRRGGAKYVLFRLPELMAAPMDETIFVVEGERCADALVALGLTATTSAGGAGGWGLGAGVYAGALRDRRVVVLPDADRPGQAHAADIIKDVLLVAAELRVIVLPGLPHKGDVVNWFAGGRTREQLLTLVERAPIMRAPSKMFPKAVDVRVLDATGIGVPTA